MSKRPAIDGRAVRLGAQDSGHMEKLIKLQVGNIGSNPILPLMYEYKATITRVVDGDTVDAIIDLGCGVQVKERLRLRGINAPEMRGKNKKQGEESRRHLVGLLWEHCENSYYRADIEVTWEGFTIDTHKDRRGKYGRYLATIKCDDSTIINDKMVEDGHAVYATY